MAMSAKPSAIWRPLDKARREIRILIVLPGNYADPVSCRLETHSVDNSPRYEALSWTWGIQPADKAIRVDQIEHLVTENLHQALLRLRESAKPRPCWIDAICIDQSNLKEKEWQLPMMKEIYSQSLTTIIWLGEMDKWALKLRDMTESIVGRSNTEVSAADWRIFSSLIKFRIFQHSWWTRLWTIQEAVLPKNDPVFMLGSWTLSWATLWEMQDRLDNILGQQVIDQKVDIDEAWKKAYDDRIDDILEVDRLRDTDRTMDYGHNQTLVSNITILQRAMRMEYQNSNTSRFGFDIISLLLRSATSQATQPQDKIYGLLGLLNPNDAGRIEVSCTKPQTELYGALAIQMWTSNWYNAHIYRYCDLGPGVPSWVPNYGYAIPDHVYRVRSEQTWGNPAFAWLNPKILTYLACKGSKPICRQNVLASLPESLASEAQKTLDSLGDVDLDMKEFPRVLSLLLKLDQKRVDVSPDSKELIFKGVLVDTVHQIYEPPTSPPEVEAFNPKWSGSERVDILDEGLAAIVEGIAAMWRWLTEQQKARQTADPNIAKHQEQTPDESFFTFWTTTRQPDGSLAQMFDDKRFNFTADETHRIKTLVENEMNLDMCLAGIKNILDNSWKYRTFIMQFMRRTGDILVNFALTSTFGGRAAKVPLNPQSGDVIALLCGFSTPMALRPQAEGKFMMIGHANLSGFMSFENLHRIWTQSGGQVPPSRSIVVR